MSALVRPARVAALLPPAAVAVEALGADWEGELLPEEQPVVARSVEKRRREFSAGRVCARAALSALGAPAGPLLPGDARQPLWPDGVVGAITHCRGYCGAAVAWQHDVVSLGIDAEPHRRLPGEVDRLVLTDPEREWIAELSGDGTHWDKFVFSAKESVYKAWYPLTGRWLGFKDAVLAVDPVARTFTAELLVEGPHVGGSELRSFEGRFAVVDGLVLTAVAVLPPAG